MIQWLTSVTGFSLETTLFLAAVVFVAGLVRGFAGFALSAMVMASAAAVVPPVDLIPICWWLEMSASILMLRGGWRDADRRIVLGLFIGSTLGMPLGLLLTVGLPIEMSKVLALILVAVLAATQLAKLRLDFLATPAGLYGSGLMAGIATGIASVGGMVVALYVLARDAPAAVMRASLVLFLFAGSLTSMVTLLYFGVMDTEATIRGLVFSPLTMVGVFLGKMLFTPRYEAYYKPFCLSLLIGLALAGLAQLAPWRMFS